MKTFWRYAQAFSVAATLAILALLLTVPDLGLLLTWHLLIPIVPAILLVAPRAWRNVCPVAVLHQLPLALGRGGKRQFPFLAKHGMAITSAGLFLVIVPMRIPLFNSHPLALAVFIAAVVVVCIGAGLRYSGNGGWCSSICPVLPVERLYGQQPVIDLPHVHCSTCIGCVGSCYDMNPSASLVQLATPGGPQTVPETEASHPLRTATGLFAAAFPGFIVGYFTVDQLASLPFIYLWVLAASGLSILLVTIALRWIPMSRLLPVLAGTAAVIYYWFSIPDLAETVHKLSSVQVADPIVQIVRLMAIAAIGAWIVQALRGSEYEMEPGLQETV
jgi:hypothetical protein